MTSELQAFFNLTILNAKLAARSYFEPVLWLRGAFAGGAEFVARLWDRFLHLVAPLYPAVKWLVRGAGALIIAVLGAYVGRGIFGESLDVNLKVLQPLLEISMRYPVPVRVGLALTLVLVFAARAGHTREQIQQHLRDAFRVYAPVEQIKLGDLEMRSEERPFFGTYFPRKAVEDIESPEIDVAMISEFTEEDLARLLRDNQGFLLVDHLYAGKTLTLFHVLRRMKGYVVVSPDPTRPVPDQEVFELLKGRKVVIVLDDLATYAWHGYNLGLFTQRMARVTRTSCGVAATCRDGADFTAIVADRVNPVTYFYEDKLRLKLRLGPMTVDDRRALARTAGWDLNPSEARLYPYPGNITLRERTAVMQQRFRVLLEPEKDVLRAMKLLDAGGVPVTVPRIRAALMGVFNRSIDPSLEEDILRKLWEQGFLREQPSGSAAHPHFGHLAYAVSYREGSASEDDYWDKLVDSLEEIQDVDALVHIGDTFGQRGDLFRAVQAVDGALRIAPEHEEGHFRRGYSLARLGRLEEALEANGRALELRPDFAEAYNNRGYILSLQGHFSDALVALQKALELRPNYDDAHVNRAIVLARLGRLQEAMNEFNIALGLRPESYYAYLNLGITLSRQDAFEEALTAFDHALRLRPNYPQAYLNRGITLARMEQFEKALEAQEHALKLDRNYPEAHMHRGQTLANLRRFREAIEAFDRAIELRENYAMAYVNRARTFSHMGPEHREAASRDWGRALALGVSLPRKNIAIGVSLARHGAFQQAMETFNRLIDLYPNYPEAHLNRGITLARMESYGEALSAFDQALALRPDYPEAHLNRGITLARQDSFEEALSVFEQALALRPNYPEAYLNRGITLARMEKYPEALSAFEQALALRPNYPEAYHNRGITLDRMERYAEAQSAFDQALALRPGYAEAHLNRGVTLDRMERYAEALSAFEQLLALRPDYAEAHYQRGRTLAALGRYDAALPAFDRAIEFHQAYPEAHCDRGSALANLGRHDEALAAIDTALALRPEFAEAYCAYGYVLTTIKGFDKSRLERALYAYEEAVRLRPDYPEAHRERGFILAQLRRDEEALAAYNQAIELRSEFSEALFGKARALCFLARKDPVRFPAKESFREAIELLERAKEIDRDTITRNVAKDRHAFRELRSDPEYADRFRALIWNQARSL